MNILEILIPKRTYQAIKSFDPINLTYNKTDLGIGVPKSQIHDVEAISSVAATLVHNGWIKKNSDFVEQYDNIKFVAVSKIPPWFEFCKKSSY